MEVEIYRNRGLAACTLRVDSKQVQAAFDEVYEELGRNVKVPGFRRGKVPRNLLTARVDRGEMRQLVLSRLIPPAIDELMARYQLRPLEPPSVEDFYLREGEDLVVRVSLVEAPKVTLPEYKGLSAELPTATDTEGDLERLRARILREHISYEPSDEEVVGENSTVLARVEVREDEQLVMLQERGRVDLADPETDPSLRKHLMGAEVGEEREFERATTPEEKEKRPGTFKVRVLEVQRRQVPELNDQFAREKFGIPGVAALDEALKRELAVKARREAEQAVRRELVRKVVEGAEVHVPIYSAVRLAAALLREHVDTLRQVGLSLEEGGGPASVDQAFAEILAVAKNQTKERLVLHEIARLESIVANDEEAIARLTERRPDLKNLQDAEVVRLIEVEKSALLYEKVRGFLFQNAVVKGEEQPGEEAAPAAEPAEEAPHAEPAEGEEG